MSLAVEVWSLTTKKSPRNDMFGGKTKTGSGYAMSWWLLPLVSRRCSRQRKFQAKLWYSFTHALLGSPAVGGLGGSQSGKHCLMWLYLITYVWEGRRQRRKGWSSKSIVQRRDNEREKTLPQSSLHDFKSPLVSGFWSVVWRPLVAVCRTQNLKDRWDGKGQMPAHRLSPR